MKADLTARAFTEQFLAPWNAHDVEAVLASLPGDFAWQFTVGTEPTGAVYRGTAELRVGVEKLFATVPDIHYGIVDLHEGPNHLVMEVLVTGNNRETGAALNFQACDIVLFDGADGKQRLVEKRSYRKVVTAG
jgi:beta-alanine degradation protein BauB